MDPHFQFLYDSLVETHKGYAAYIMSTTSAILLIIGWMMTSGTAREFIGSHTAIKTSMIIAIVLFLGLEWYLASNMQKRSAVLTTEIQSVVANIKERPINANYYSGFVVSSRAPVLFTLAHAVLYGVLVVLILKIKKPLAATSVAVPAMLDKA